MLNTPLQMFLVTLAGWMSEQQRAVNAYLKEENRVLRELHGNQRLRFSATLAASDCELRGALSLGAVPPRYR